MKQRASAVVRQKSAKQTTPGAAVGDASQLLKAGPRAGAGLSAIPREPASGSAIPAALRSRLEARSGVDLSDVQVHRNSTEPARLDALAFARGGEIHLGPGQEKHLAHEAWHVVQQRAGRVRANRTVRGAPVNDDPALEREADRAV